MEERRRRWNDDLRREHWEWERRNFGEPDVDNSVYGCIEELGELVHAVLKRRQHIREGRRWSDHHAAATDAVGDFGVYLMSLANVLENKTQPGMSVVFLDVLEALVSALKCFVASGYSNEQELQVESLFESLMTVLGVYVDYQSSVHETWKKVRERDWVANPENGGVD